MKCLRAIYNAGKDIGLYFYRDSNGNEVDILIKNKHKYDLLEVKSSQTFHPDFIKGITAFEKAFPELVGQKHIIYTGESTREVFGTEISNFKSYFVKNL